MDVYLRRVIVGPLREDGKMTVQVGYSEQAVGLILWLEVSDWMNIDAFPVYLLAAASGNGLSFL